MRSANPSTIDQLLTTQHQLLSSLQGPLLVKLIGCQCQTLLSLHAALLGKAVTVPPNIACSDIRPVFGCSGDNIQVTQRSKNTGKLGILLSIQCDAIFGLNLRAVARGELLSLHGQGVIAGQQSAQH
ncbi:Uncharacterised protein [Yersinia frederiksenii]|nr:Uncharacterised protein [Yersinia frederiksenii]